MQVRPLLALETPGPGPPHPSHRFQLLPPPQIQTSFERGEVRALNLGLWWEL